MNSTCKSKYPPVTLKQGRSELLNGLLADYAQSSVRFLKVFKVNDLMHPLFIVLWIDYFQLSTNEKKEAKLDV